MKSKLAWLEAALLLTPFVLLLVSWNDLPARVPIHWNLAGEIDRWGPKAFILVLPLVALVVAALFYLVSWIDPKLRQAKASSGRMGAVLPLLNLAFSAFCLILFLMLLAAAFGRSVATDRIVPTAVLLLLAVIGNYAGNLRPNYFIGLRTPWTLESPATWRATHRLGGRLIFYGAIALLVLQFILSARLFFVLLITAILALVVWTFLYSWYHFRTVATSHRNS